MPTRTFSLSERVRLTRQPDLERLRGLLPDASIDWVSPVLSVRLNGKEPIEERNAVLLRALLDEGVGVLGLETGESLEATYLASRGHDRKQ